MLKALLLYWLSWFVLSREPEDGLNSYLFSLAIPLAKVERLAFPPIYLGSLYTCLDKSANNISRSLGR